MDPMLLKAARTGNVKRIRTMGDVESCFLSGTTPQGNTALHMAARFGHTDLVEEIINLEPVLVLKSNLKGETPVHVAARAGHEDVIKKLIKFVQDLKNVHIARIQDKYGNTPLHFAVRNDHWEVVKLLAENDTASLLLLNDAGESPLSIAIDLKLSSIAESIIAMNPDTLDYRGPKGQNPLHCAIVSRDLDTILRILINADKLVKDEDNDKRSPLHYAAAMGSQKMVKMLLIVKEDISVAYQKDTNGETPVHLAALNGQASVLKVLLDPCPDIIELLNNKERNILHLAAKNGNIDAVSFILKLPEMEDLINSPDANGNTPLHLAAKKFHSSVVYILSRHPNVKIRATNEDKLTALAIVQSSDACGMELQKHLTLKALKRSYAMRAANAEDILDYDPWDDINGKKVEKLGNGKGNEIQLVGKSKDMAQTLQVMATLIATFTFTAAFTLPGGFKNEGPDEGMATLIKKSAFKAFVITDTVAMTSSLTAAVMVFWSSSRRDDESFMDLLPFAIGLTWISLVAMALAFVTGLFVVLSNSLWLAILVCVIGCASPAFLYIFAPTFLVLFDKFSSSRSPMGPRRNIVEDNPFLFVFRLAKMIA